MQPRFVGQPFADGSDLRDFLSLVVGDATLTQLKVVVAWAKRSGLERVQPLIESLRDRGGTASIIVGIDEGGATKQGLALAIDLFDTAHVFHDESGRTFHPKIYVCSGEGAAELLVGSHNLTAGGVYFNYEAALAGRLDLSNADDRRLYDDVTAYVQRLNDDAAVCLELREDTLAALVANPRYRIGDEDRAPTPRQEDDAPENADSEGAPTAAQGEASLFGRSAHPKRAGIPRPATAAPRPRRAAARVARQPRPAAPSVPKTQPAVPAAAASTLTPNAQVRRRWYKKLDASSAQHPPTAGTNVTGVLRLGQARLGINPTTYFRREFFGGAPWTQVGTPAKPKEQAVIPFEVTIDGRALGTHNLMIDHAAHREAAQHNVPTVLHWGDLGRELSNTNYTDFYVVLERLSVGGFKLHIVENDPGRVSFIE